MVNNRAQTCSWGVEGMLQRQGVDTPSTGVFPPDVIWHIYSCMHYSMGDGGRDLPSSGEVVLGKEQVPCEFRADQTKCLSLRNLNLLALVTLVTNDNLQQSHQ